MEWELIHRVKKSWPVELLCFSSFVLAGFISDAQAQTNTPSQADPRVTKTLAPTTGTSVAVNDALAYYVKVDNALGRRAATNITAKDVLANGLQYVSTDVSYDGGTNWSNNIGGVSTSVSSGVTTITLPTISRIDSSGAVYNSSGASLGSANVLFRINGLATGSVTGPLTNTASITTTGTNADTSNDSSSVGITVSATPSTGGNSACEAAGGTIVGSNLLSNGNFGTLSGSSYADLLPYATTNGVITKARGSPYVYKGGSTGSGLLVSETTYLITGQRGSGVPLNAYGPWQPYFGHNTNTDPTDAYLAVNGSTASGANIISGRVSVGTTKVYEFGIWGRSPHSLTSQFGGTGSGAKLSLTSSSVTGGTTEATVTGASPEITAGTPWTRYGIILGSGQSGTLTFGIGNSTTISSGNDYYLDDMYVYQCNLPTGTVSGTVFTDTNTNAALTAGEPGIAGVTVKATDKNGAVYTTTTSSTGAYSFLNLPAALGPYTVAVDGTSAPLSGLSATTAVSTLNVTVTAGNVSAGGDFGYVAPLRISKAVSAGYVKVTPDAANDTLLTASPAQLTYTLTVKNVAGTSATNVKVVDTLPAGLTYSSATGSPALASGNPVVSGQQLTFNVASLAAGATQTITIVANVTPAANTNAPAYLNSATVTSAQVTNRVVSNEVRTDVIYTKLLKRVHNLGSGATATSPAAPASSPAWSSSGTGLPNEVLEYCIDFYNYGSVTLNNYTVSDNIPANTAYVAGSAVLLGGTMAAPTGTYRNSAASPVAAVAPVYNTASPPVVTSIKASNIVLEPNRGGNMCFRATIK